MLLKFEIIRIILLQSAYFMLQVMSEMERKEARSKDAQRLARVPAATWQYAYQGQLREALLYGRSVNKRVQSWQENLSNPAPRSTVWVAEAQGQILGFCTVGP